MTHRVSDLGEVLCIITETFITIICHLFKIRFLWIFVTIPPIYKVKIFNFIKISPFLGFHAEILNSSKKIYYRNTIFASKATRNDFPWSYAVKNWICRYVPFVLSGIRPKYHRRWVKMSLNRQFSWIDIPQNSIGTTVEGLFLKNFDILGCWCPAVLPQEGAKISTLAASEFNLYFTQIFQLY